MAENPVLKIRLAPEARARWEEAAERDGFASLSEFVRAAAERAASGAAQGTPAADRSPKASIGQSVGVQVEPAPLSVAALLARRKTGVPAADVPQKRRTTMCVHRRPPNGYCKHCDDE